MCLHGANPAYRIVTESTLPRGCLPYPVIIVCSHLMAFRCSCTPLHLAAALENEHIIATLIEVPHIAIDAIP